MGGYNLYDPTEDDEDPLTKAMRERFMAGGERQYSQPDSSLDPGMVQSFLNQRAPEADQAPPYPIPNRGDESHWSDYVAPALAMTADLVVGQRGPNGRRVTGTQVGNIAGMAMQQRDQQRARGDQQFENDRKAYIQMDDSGLQKQRLQQAGRSQDQRQQEIDLQSSYQALQREKFLSGLDSPETKAAELEFKKAQIAHQNAMTAQMAIGEDGLTSEQRERGRDRDADRDARGQVARDNAASRELQSRIAADAKAAAAAEARRIQQDKTDTRDTTSFLDKTKNERAQGKRLQGVEPIIDKYKGTGDTPGIGLADSNLPSWLMHPFDAEQRQDADAMKQLYGAATDYYNLAITGAAGTPKERQLREMHKALNGTEEQFRTAIKFWQDDVKGALRTRGTAAPRVARDALNAEGLGEWSGVPEYQEPPAAALSPGSVYQAGNGRRQAAGYDPMSNGLVNGDPLQAVDTGGRSSRDVPPIPAQAPIDLKVFQDEDEDFGVRYH